MINRYDIEKILDKNIKEIPYEGKEIDKYSIIEELLDLINKLPETTNGKPNTEQIDNALDCLQGDNSCDHYNVIDFLNQYT